jgi:hypothetical protein
LWLSNLPKKKTMDTEIGVSNKPPALEQAKAPDTDAPSKAEGDLDDLSWLTFTLTKSDSKLELWPERKKHLEEWKQIANTLVLDEPTISYNKHGLPAHQHTRGWFRNTIQDEGIGKLYELLPRPLR